MPQPMPPGGNPMGGTPAAGGQPSQGTLSMPRPFTQGPLVTEQRNGAATFAPPMPGTTYPIVSPFQPIAAGPVPAADGGLFPLPDMDAPLVGGGYPAGLAAATSACNKWWLSAEYLLWWTKSPSLPPLVTTSLPVFSPFDPSEGVLGVGSTRVVVDDGTFGNDLHNGGRFGVGYWFGTEQRWGVEGSGFFLGRNAATFTADGSTLPIIARPFTIANNNQPFSEVIATPDPLNPLIGSVAVDYDTALWGGEVNLRRFLDKTGCARLDLVSGFRFVQLNEQLRISEFSVRPADMATGFAMDEFRTENDFYGWQFGLVGEIRRGRWFATATGKVALGTMFQSSQISGQQSVILGGVPTSAVGGLLALPGANIGTQTQNKFACVPEVGVNIGYHLGPRCRIFVGYNFLYLSNVLRPGDQIDPVLDVTRIPNFSRPEFAAFTPLAQPRPAPRLKDSDFFAQGLTFGLQLTW
jgi:hypothetical protein